MAREGGSPVAWVLDNTGLTNQGNHLVGVGRQCSGVLGNVRNCQSGVSLRPGLAQGPDPQGPCSRPISARFFKVPR